MYTAWRPVGTAVPPCPEEDNTVGIGTQFPTAKLSVRGNAIASIIEASPGPLCTATNGVLATITAPTGGTLQANYKAVVGEAFNATGDNQGGSFAGTLQTGFSTTSNYGTFNQGLVQSGATVTTNHGARMMATGLSGSTVTDNFAVKAEADAPATNKNTAVDADARNGARNIGVRGNATSSGNASGFENTGVSGHGESTDAATVCHGVKGTQNGPDTYSGNITKWAGHFTGNTFATNQAWTSSDALLKQNIQDLAPEVAREKVLALQPKTYDFNQEAFPTLNLPSQPQIGFDAAQVQGVLPELVAGIIHPQVQNEEGEVIAEQIEHKIMNYQGLIPVLVGAVQAQNEQFQSVDERLTQTENALAETQATLAAAMEALSTANATIQQLQAAQAEQTRAMDDCCTQHQQLQDRITSPQGDDANGLWVVPNPVARETQLRYRLAEAGRVRLVVAGSDGRNVQELRSEEAMAGEHLYYWNTSGIAPGQYSVVLYLNDALLVKRVVKVQE